MKLKYMCMAWSFEYLITIFCFDSYRIHTQIHTPHKHKLHNCADFIGTYFEFFLFTESIFNATLETTTTSSPKLNFTRTPSEEYYRYNHNQLIWSTMLPCVLFRLLHIAAELTVLNCKYSQVLVSEKQINYIL